MILWPGNRTVVIVFFLFLSQTCFTQRSDFFLKPRALTLYANGNGMWEISEGVSGQWMDFLRIRGQLLLGWHLSLVAEDITRIYKNGPVVNELAQAYVQYSNAVSHKRKFPLFRYPTLITISTGKLVWYPTFRDPRLIAENIDLFKDPVSFYGISADLNMPLLRDRSLSIRISGHTGDLIGNATGPQLENLYVNFRHAIYKKFGIAVQVGIAQGSQHVINYAYLYYVPKIEQLQIGLKAGKLVSLDAIPYGFEISIERRFKYIAIGGYYQRRINQRSYFEQQKEGSQIFGFTWRITGPPKLKYIFDTYQFIYDSNTQTFRFIIPFCMANFFFK